MTLHYTIRQDDYFYFRMYHFNHSKNKKYAILLLSIHIGALTLYHTGQLNQSPPTHFWLSVVLSWVFGVGFIAMLPWLFRKIAAKSYRRGLQKGTALKFLGECTLELGENGLIFTRVSTKMEFGYNAVARVVQTEHAVFVYTNPATCILITPAAFADDGEKEQFLQLLKQKRKAAREAD